MKKLFLYGDSNTFGFDPRDPFGGRYPASVRWVDRLQTALAGEWEILSDGMNGRCIPASEVTSRRVAAALQAAGPFDLFGVMLGTNDYLCEMLPDPEETAEKMERFLFCIRRELPSLPILLITPPAMDFGDDPELCRYSTSDGHFSRAYQALAETSAGGSSDVASGQPSLHPIFVLDTDPWKLEMAFDRVHLSPEGHLRFAEGMEHWLKTNVKSALI